MSSTTEGGVLPLYADLQVSALRTAAALRTRSTRLKVEVAVLAAADTLALLAVVWWAASWDAVLAFAAAAVVWHRRGLYDKRFALSVLDDISSIALGAMSALAVLAVLQWPTVSAAVPISGALLAASMLARAVSYRTVLRLRKSGRINYSAVVLGAGHTGMNLVRRMQDHPETGLRPLGFLDDAPISEDLPAPLMGEPQELPDIVGQGEISDVVVAYGGLSSADLVEVLRTCERLAVDIHVVPRLFEMHRLNSATDQIWGVPLVRIRRRTFRGVSWRLKRAMDATLSGIALLVLAPVMAATALAVRLELGHGVLFKQIRVGVDGRAFMVRKFRSMKHLPSGVESPWNVASDERIGTVGRFIRRYSLDELPQLFDVFIGNMSLVGPRPERPEYVEQFCEEVPRYWARHRVPVGLTGLAAVHGLRGNTSITDRAYFDNLYIENWSLWLDIKIMARTVLAVLRGTGG